MISAFATRQVATQQRAKATAAKQAAEKEAKRTVLRAQAEDALRAGAPPEVLRAASDEKKAADAAAARARLAEARAEEGVRALREVGAAASLFLPNSGYRDDKASGGLAAPSAGDPVIFTDRPPLISTPPATPA